MTLIVGMDGGGSGCRVQAMLANQRRTPMLQAGPANVFSDPDGALRVVTRLLAQCIKAARELDPAQDLSDPQIVLGLAGATETGAGEWLRAALPYRQVQVLGDIETTLSGALHDADGMVLAVGTGSVLAAQFGGQMRRLGGHGFVLGDQGGGAWIGRQALAACLMAEDGLARAGSLTRALTAHLGSAADMIAFSGRARPADFAQLAPLVLDHDAQHCPVAGQILDAACSYFRRAIAVLQQQHEGLPLAATGGLGPILLERMLRQGGLQLRMVAPLGTALDGALWRASRLAMSTRTGAQ